MPCTNCSFCVYIPAILLLKLGIDLCIIIIIGSIAVVAPSTASVCSRSLARIVGSNPAEVMDVSLVRVVCRQVEVFAAG
jgi:hypothetical protein